MAETTLDTLTIEIKANSEAASKAITGMIAPLRSLARSLGTVLPVLRSVNIELRKLGAFKGLSGITNAGAGKGSGSAGGMASKLKEESHAMRTWINDLSKFQAKASTMPRFRRMMKEDPSYFKPSMYGPRPLFNINNRKPYSRSDGLSEAIRGYADANGGRNPYRGFPGIDMGNGYIHYATDMNGNQIAPYPGGRPPRAPGIYRIFDTPPVPPTPPPPRRPILNPALSPDKFYARWGIEPPAAAKGVATGAMNNEMGKAATSAAQASSSISTVNREIGQTKTKADGATKGLRKLDKELRQKKPDGQRAKNGLDQAAGGARKVGDEADKASKKGKVFGGVLSTIGRIAKTMLIRTALRSLMKAFSQSWQAAYAFSDKLNGSFGKAIDASREAIANMTTSIIQALAPAIEYLTPAIVVLSEAIRYLSLGIIELFGLIGLTSDVANASVESINKYYGNSASGANKASKANKNLLASWDQLNIIQSQSNSNNSNGSSYKPGSIASVVNSELRAVWSIIVGELMFAAGLVLACSGHIGIGIGMMALGATSIVKTIASDWDELPGNVRHTISQIMGYVGWGEVAIGLILAFASPSHLPLAIGLIASGLANAYFSVAIDDGSWMSDSIKERLGYILAVAGELAVATGLIIALFAPSHLGLAIGMMVAGGAAIAGSVALQEGKLEGDVGETIATIATVTSELLVAVGLIMAFSSPAHLGLGIGLIAAGIIGLQATNAVVKGDAVSDDVKKKIATIGILSGAGLTAVGLILTFFCPAKMALGIGLIAAGVITAAMFASVSDGKQLGDDIGDSIARIAATTGALLIATGLILLFFAPSHMGLGIGLLVAGIASEAASIAIEHGKLTDDIGGYIATIATVSAALILACGLILAFTAPSHLGLGIALIASGAAAVAGIRALTIQDEVSDETKQKVEEIGRIAGAAMVGAGLIIALACPTHLGLGLALIAAGVTTTAATINWDDLKKTIDTKMSDILKATGDIALLVGLILTLSGVNVPLGVALLAYGGISLATGLHLDWEKNESKILTSTDVVVKNLKSGFDSVGDTVDGTIGKVKDLKSAIESLPKISYTPDQIAALGASQSAKGGYQFQPMMMSKPKNEVIVINKDDGSRTEIHPVPNSGGYFADGGYGIPKGDLFIANEAGAELVGSMNGKTTVANQNQIIEGIQHGVESANADQNALLRQQNELLTKLLNKQGDVKVVPSAEWGRFNERSNDMWAMATGR